MATSTQRRPLYNGHFFADSPYIDSCLNLFTMASFFGTEGGRCVEVQLWKVSQFKAKQFLDPLQYPVDW